MYLDEVMRMINDPNYERAKQSMYLMLREGLTNGAAIPEVETEAEQAAHHMLGCDNYLALITTYATAEDVRKDEPMAAAVISTMCDEHLMLLTQAVLSARGPIGEHKCVAGKREPA
jgi:hypothetical protein